MSGALRITNRERVLLALEDAREHADRFEVPRRFSQPGLAGRLGMAQSHVSRALKALDGAGQLTQARRRVSGERRRIMTYGLTETGQDAAADLHAALLAVEILTEGEDGTLDLVGCDALFSRWTRVGWRRPADGLALGDLLRQLPMHEGHPRLDAPPELLSVDPAADLSSETIGLHLELAELRRAQGDAPGAVEHLLRAADLHRTRGSKPGEARCRIIAATLGAPLGDVGGLRTAALGLARDDLRLDTLLQLHELTGDLDSLAAAFAERPPFPMLGHIGFRLAGLQQGEAARATLETLRDLFAATGDLRGVRVCEVKLGRPSH